MTSLILHTPVPFTPDDPDAFYASMLSRMPQGADGSLYWSTLWCHYVGKSQERTKHKQAREMRWMAQEWRARQGEKLSDANQPKAPRKRACDLCAATNLQKQRTAAEGRQRAMKAKEAACIEAYKKEGSVVAAAKVVGIYESGVREILRGAGIEIEKHPNRVKPMPLPELPGLYESGMSMPAIAERLGVSHCTVKNHVARLASEGVLKRRGHVRATT